MTEKEVSNEKEMNSRLKIEKRFDGNVERGCFTARVFSPREAEVQRAGVGNNNALCAGTDSHTTVHTETHTHTHTHTVV